MKLSSLSKTTIKSKKRVGRGTGSGRGGHTSSRGQKGQNSRTKVGLFFEGTKFKKSLIKRLPFFRGKGKLKSRKPETVVLNIKFLGKFKAGDEVTIKTLKEKGIIAKEMPENFLIKILGDGEINIPLTVKLACSNSAKEKIEKAGGKVALKDDSIVKEETKPGRTKK